MNLHGALMEKTVSICSHPGFMEAIERDVNARFNRYNSSIFNMVKLSSKTHDDDSWANEYITYTGDNN